MKTQSEKLRARGLMTFKSKTEIKALYEKARTRLDHTIAIK